MFEEERNVGQTGAREAGRETREASQIDRKRAR